jgi:hypothetical protein
VSSAYENVPQRIGNAERDAAVERLRVNLDEGRLDQPTYETRVATALAATTQDDLVPLFQDLPPVVSSISTFELYPHQGVAPVPSAYVSDPVPQEEAQPTPVTNPAHWFTALPTWGKIVTIVIIVALASALFSSHMWWFIFFFPAIFGRWGRNNQFRNTRNRQRRY